MRIGIPKEIKEHEYRVSLTPQGVKELVNNGHEVIVERSAGSGSGFPDDDYLGAGAELSDKRRLFDKSDLIVKVKEPLPAEYEFFREGQAVFTFLHLAANPELTEFLLMKKITGLAYETLEIDGYLPLLIPMSEIAGKMSPVIGAYYLQKIHGGSGILLAGVSGVSPAEVLILGAGTAGMSALRIVRGIGAEITVINRGEDKLRTIDNLYKGEVNTLISTEENIEKEVLRTDLLIGAVLVAGSRTPSLVSRELVSKMKKGSVIVDISVDQGGCVETTRPTNHSNPVYTVDGVIHYCVANMPGAYPKTSTLALAGRTLEYIKMIADIGIDNVVKEETPLRNALNTYNGGIMHKALADSIGNI